MDEIKQKIDEIVKKVTNDKNFATTFKENPVKAVEDVLGVDLPDDVINNVIDGVKAKLTADTAKNVLGKITDMFKKN